MKLPIWTAVVFAATISPSARAVPSRPAAFRAAQRSFSPHPAVVRVIVPDGDGMSLGSGALVAVHGAHGLVVTNWHVVRDAVGQIIVVFPDGFRSGATLLATDSDWDLAALAIWRPPAEPIRLAARPPLPGELLTIAGYGPGWYRTATGRCIQYVSPGGNHPFEMVEVSAAARNGDSGGPILNDRGELAGVLFGAAHGRTTGSHSRPVGRFLASVSDRFWGLSQPSTVLAQTDRSDTSSSNQTALPPAAVISARTHPRFGSGVPQPSTPTRVSTSGWTAVGASSHDHDAAAGSPTESFPQQEPEEAQVTEMLEEQAGRPLTWEDVVGKTRPEQVKTVLAALGAFAVLFHLLRFVDRG